MVSRLKKLDLIYFIFLFTFSFLFLEQIGLGLICHNSHLIAKSQNRSQDLGEFSRRFENR